MAHPSRTAAQILLKAAAPPGCTLPAGRARPRCEQDALHDITSKSLPDLAALQVAQSHPAGQSLQLVLLSCPPLAPHRNHHLSLPSSHDEVEMFDQRAVRTCRYVCAG